MRMTIGKLNAFRPSLGPKQKPIPPSRAHKNLYSFYIKIYYPLVAGRLSPNIMPSFLEAPMDAMRTSNFIVPSSFRTILVGCRVSKPKHVCHDDANLQGGGKFTSSLHRCMRNHSTRRPRTPSRGGGK